MGDPATPFHRLPAPALGTALWELHCGNCIVLQQHLGRVAEGYTLASSASTTDQASQQPDGSRPMHDGFRPYMTGLGNARQILTMHMNPGNAARQIMPAYQRQQACTWDQRVQHAELW
jgi:hypothetical protein